MKFLSQINVNTRYTLPMVDGTNGQVLSTDGNGVAYWGTISIGSLPLDGLSDVIITSPSSDQMLRYGLRQGDTVPVWHNFTPNFLTPSSSINALNDVVITTAAVGQILQYNGSAWVNATLSTVEYVSKVQHTVKAGVAIAKGQAVYVTSSNGTNMIVGLASNASESTSSKTMGLAASTAAINDNIFVVTEGLLAGLDTSTATAGDPVWLGTSGNLIFGLLNKPVAPAHLVFIGIVTRVQQNNGEIFVKVQNGFELNEIHDVLISSPATGQLIRRESDGLWKNWTPNFLTSLPAHNHNDAYYTKGEIDSFFNGEEEIEGYNRGAWDIAYNDKINSASFSTTTGVLTLTQQDTGTITVDLDGRYLESEADTLQTVTTRGSATTTGMTIAGSVGIGITNPGSNLTVGTSFATIPGITIDTGDTGNSAFVARKTTSKPAFGLLPWDAGVFLSSGIYYDGNQWIHHSNDTHNQLFVLEPSTGVRFYASDNGTGSWNVSSNILLWDNSSIWKSLIRSTRTGDSFFTGGNVGIGTTVPAAPLDVNGNVYIREAGALYTNTIAGYSTNVVSIGASTNFIVPSGNVGINTTTPKKLLDVNGSGIVASFGGGFSPGSFAGLHFGYSESYVNSDNYKKSALVFERTDNHGQGGNASGKIHFLLNNIGSGSATSLAHSVMVIDTNSTATQGSARVGIGTTSPNATLDVNGAANATSFSSTALLITNADTSGSLQPDQGDPANKIYSFRWQGNEVGYIDTDNKITFSGFKTPAGTSSQFLKANGTVDSNTYITSTALNGYATESWVNTNYYNRDQIDDFFGGAEAISGYNKSNWDAAYNDKINSASFSTTTGVLTLTQQDTGTVTVDLDGRYLESLPAHNHDDRYYTETESDSRYINASGDTMSGSLSFDAAAVIKKKITGVGDNPVKTASGVLASRSDNGGGYTYYVIETNVPQDDYQMGGFTIELFGRYGETNNKTKIDLGGYWNSESNGGFIGFEAHGTNPQYKPTIEVSRNSEGKTAFIIYGVSLSYPVIVARDLWLGYSQTDGSTYGEGWTIRGTNDVSSYTNKDTVVWRNAYSDSNPAGYITGYTETDTLASVTARGASTSTNSVFTGGLQARKNQTNNNYTTAALWTESYGNTTTGIAFHISGNVGKFLEMRTDGILYWEDRQVWTSGNLTNLNQLSNGPGYITSYSETDTLASVTGRGATTATVVNFTAAGSAVNLTGLGSNITFKDQDNVWTGYVGFSGNTGNLSFPGRNVEIIAGYNGTITLNTGASGYDSGRILVPYGSVGIGISPSTKLHVDGVITATGGTSSNWNTAYNDRISSAAVTGTTTKTLTLTQGDGGTITASWTDYDTDNDAQQLTWDKPSITLSISNGNSIALEGLATEEFVTGQGYITGSYLPLSGGTLTGTLTMGTTGTQYIRMGRFPNSTTNTGEAWIGRAADRSAGTMTVQLGGNSASSRSFEVVDYAWSVVLFSVGSDGNLSVSGTITENSSIRYKKDIVDIESTSSKVQLLRPVKYKKIRDESEEIGLIAEDVAELFPEVVKYDNEGRPDGVNYSRLSVILLKAVQELTERVNKLENK